MTCSAFIIFLQWILYIDEILPLGNRGTFKVELKQNIDQITNSIHKIDSEAEVLASVKSFFSSCFPPLFGNTKLRNIFKSKHASNKGWSEAMLRKMLKCCRKNVSYHSIFYFFFINCFPRRWILNLYNYYSDTAPNCTFLASK